MTALACVAGAIWAGTAYAGTNARTSRLLVSMQPDRSSSVALDGASLGRPAYIFVKPGRAAVNQVVFTLDPGTDTARQVTELNAPYDFGGTNADGTAGPLDISTLARGSHAMTAAVKFADGRERVLSATFNVSGGTTPTSTTTAAPTTTSTTTAAPTTTTTPTTTPPPPTTTTAPPTTTPPPSRTCTNPVFVTSDTNGGWSTAGYYVHNNVWNPQEAGPETLYACAHNNWYVDSTQPNTTSVKAYPNVHLDINNMNGAPLSNYRTITSSFGSTGGPRVGIYNVAYDVWLNGVGWGGGTTEFMVWTENFNQRPLGSVRATPTFGNMTYDAWHYNNGDANVISLVAKSTMLSGTLNLKEMFDWAISRGMMPPNPTVNQIDYGVEICSTNNTKQRWTFTDFSVTMA